MIMTFATRLSSAQHSRRQHVSHYGEGLTSCGLTPVSFNLQCTFDLSFIHPDLVLRGHVQKVGPVLCWMPMPDQEG